MDINKNNTSIDVYSLSAQEDLLMNSKENSKWKSYRCYRLMLCASMFTDAIFMNAPNDISQEGFYTRVLIQILTTIFIGIPVVYSEISIAQYVNCSSISLWDFFPLFRGFGYGMIFTLFVKSITMMVRACWYLKYTFYSIYDVPPWYSCKGFDNCMVRRINVTVFQHCMEMQKLLQEDCKMKTASNYVYMNEIGNNTTLNRWPLCAYNWKYISEVSGICILIILLSLKSIKWLQNSVKFFACYVVIFIFILFCMSMSTNGVWSSTVLDLNIIVYNFYTFLEAAANALLALGTGQGILLFLSNDVPFRSPATKTAILMPLCSLFLTLTLSFIASNGLSAMIYYHGDENYIMETDYSPYFHVFASIAEIMMYFKGETFCAFVWFSISFLCVFFNLWLFYVYMRYIFVSNKKFKNILSVCIPIFLCLLAQPVFCVDVTIGISDSLQIIQLISNLFFTLAVYWIYGIREHSIDILFMIGVNVNYFWKLTWLASPILITILLVGKINTIGAYIHNHNSYYIDILKTEVDELMCFVFILAYILIILIGSLTEIVKYLKNDKFSNIVRPTTNWGPVDSILFRSRKMFVPEIMTREFLYRHVRIRGMCKNDIAKNERNKDSSLESERK